MLDEHGDDRGDPFQKVLVAACDRAVERSADEMLAHYLDPEKAKIRDDKDRGEIQRIRKVKTALIDWQRPPTPSELEVGAEREAAAQRDRRHPEDRPDKRRI